MNLAGISGQLNKRKVSVHNTKESRTDKTMDQTEQNKS